MNFMYDWAIQGDKLKDHSKPRYCTRSQNKRLLQTKKNNTEKYKKSLFYYGPNKWNSLPLELHQTDTKPEFKLCAKNWMNCKYETNQILSSVALGP